MYIYIYFLYIFIYNIIYMYIYIYIYIYAASRPGGRPVGRSGGRSGPGPAHGSQGGPGPAHGYFSGPPIIIPFRTSFVFCFSIWFTQFSHRCWIRTGIDIQNTFVTYRFLRFFDCSCFPKKCIVLYVFV